MLESNISILIPAYKPDLALLERCLASIRFHNQSHPQIVIGLQGEAAIEDLCRKYDAELLHFEPPSAYRTRKALIPYAKNKYLVWFDCDDYLEPNAIDLLEDSVSTGFDLYVFNLKRRDGVLFGPKSHEILKTNREIVEKFYQDDSIPNSLCVKLVRSEVAFKTVYPEVDIFQGDDLLISYFLVKGCKTAEFLPIVIYNYADPTNSSSEKVRSNNFFDIAMVDGMVIDHDFDSGGKPIFKNASLLKNCLDTLFLACMNNDLKSLIKNYDKNFALVSETAKLNCYVDSVKADFKKILSFRGKVKLHMFDLYRFGRFKRLRFLVWVILFFKRKLC